MENALQKPSKPKSYKKRYTHIIKDLNGEEVIIKTSAVNIKKCTNCGHKYLFNKNGGIKIREIKGVLLKNINYDFKWFHTKNCRNQWIFAQHKN